ncbi:MAG: cellulose synthase/poly-beta-1,6-N-acetylglucosamine synthase-like glycosyltransferase [Paracoccaceae bacterium]|jgi:cellulose synthase/poly-beta-1,6-N-acetylglucosamine synthase-like glycosyltransferase
MSDQNLRLLDPQSALTFGQPLVPLGRHLVNSGIITSTQLVQALHAQKQLGAPLGEILVAEGWADEQNIQDALARQHGITQADLAAQPPDPKLAAQMPVEFWLKHRVIPWIQFGDTVLIATARPDQFANIRTALADVFPSILVVLAAETAITNAIAAEFSQPLARAASTRLDSALSCRTWNPPGRSWWSLACLVFLGFAVLSPIWILALCSCFAVISLFCVAGLKLFAFISQLTAGVQKSPPMTHSVPPPPGRLPKVSVLVPLFHENEIAGALITRLSRLTYPKALLDVILVLEEDDEITHQTLMRTTLPSWMRVIEVPAHGGLTTKPRALNFALDFCRGDIVGIWDAEDAPAPDQIDLVVSRFAQVDDDVVCLQGMLDYYNPRANWLAACFTIEYASWWRIILPGMARMGLVIPLGGTTLFFKRKELLALKGWDAHNVTEDADLGVRLARAGYRTELIDTVTYEEANCRVWPWIKQRSRWLKGFMVTYLVHMRRPRQLLQELGLRRFFGLQVFFIGTISQFLLAPLLWSFWVVAFGIAHPIHVLLPTSVIYGISTVFVASEILTLCIGLVAVSHTNRRFLMWRVPTMIFYFPIGVLAAFKALYELVLHPFYWDKTQHGHSMADSDTPS